MKKFVIKRTSYAPTDKSCLSKPGHIIPWTTIKKYAWMFDSREEAVEQLSNDDRERITEIEVSDADCI